MHAARDMRVDLFSPVLWFFFFFQAEDGIRDDLVTGVQTCALPIWFRCAREDATTRILANVFELFGVNGFFVYRANSLFYFEGAVTTHELERSQTLDRKSVV